MKLHRVILGREPTPIQQRLYDEFPHAVGYSDRSLNPERFQAVTVLTLVRAIEAKRGPEPHRVLMFIPPAHEAWVLEQFHTFTKDVFAYCKTLSGNRVALAKMWGGHFHQIVIAKRVLQFSEPPPYWMTFGFDREDLVPDWVRSRLVVV
jgi:hypothetical protein